MSTLRLTVERQVPLEQVYDVLTTAVEGGSGYWLFGEDVQPRSAQAIRNSDHDVTRIEFEVVVGSNDDGRRVVTPQKIVDAAQKVLDGRVQVRPDLVDQIGTLGTGRFDIDADAADVLVQVAAFGEIVYG